SDLAPKARHQVKSHRVACAKRWHCLARPTATASPLDLRPSCDSVASCRAFLLTGAPGRICGNARDFSKCERSPLPKGQPPGQILPGSLREALAPPGGFVATLATSQSRERSPLPKGQPPGQILPGSLREAL